MSSFPDFRVEKRQPVFMPMERQGKTIIWERLTIAQVIVSVSVLDWDLANLDTPDDSCNSTALFRWGSRARANGIFAPTHQSSERLPVSIGRLRLKLSFRTIRQGISLSRWFNVPNLLATYLPRLGILIYPFTCHSFLLNYSVDQSFKERGHW